MFAIVESPDRPALCAGDRTRADDAAVDPLRDITSGYAGQVVVETPSEGM
jgi:hypothetical protein